MYQILSSVLRRCFKRKREPESEDQNEPRKVLVVEGANEDVQSNSITRSTSSSSQSGWDHDVFLSFRGEDTRKNFTDHLYSALGRAGINTFRDDEGLDRGESISRELLNAIRRSRISIVIFSKGYASSTWCLDELAEIVNCKNTIGHTLLPIFYHVDPSDVRKQSKTFAEAFIWHEKRFQTDMKRVQRWREALTEVAECSGWDLESFANGYESRFIEKIVEEVSCKVNPSHLNVAEHPIGMESRVDDIKDLLNLGTSDVRIVGIYGMGGIGKTTLAKAVYNKICDVFQGNSFLSNLKESSEKHGLVHLQEQLLNDIFKTNLKICNVDSGVSIIEKRIQGKKVLVVLDDVDDFENLHKLVKKQWFGQGSRIIVTTRDERLLSQLEVDKKYKVEELNHWESLRLFSWHAFKMYNPKGDYSELSIEVVKYAGGLPLALVVLGSFLKGRAIAEWKSELKKLQRTPYDKIQKILKISFDSLEKTQQYIFLDIACFFVGMDEEDAIKIFDGCEFCPTSGIPTLIQRSLVSIDYQKKLKMHNLIRDMGREIVHEECPENPGKRSRLWFHEDGLNVLRNHLGSKRVECLILNLPEQLKTEAFRKMKILRLLQINDVDLMGSYEHLSKELKWLCWHKCPLKSLPQDFHLKYLVILDMQHSNLEQVWETEKIFNNLKVLNLSNSKSLIRSLDFSQVPQLEILILKGCTNLKGLPNFLTTPHLKSMNLEGCTSLVEIHESIGLQTGLILLNLQGCENLRNLPSSISNLKSLKTLVVSKCFSLAKLPKRLENMMALTELYMENTAIKQLPSSFIHLSNLETLSFRGCECLIESPKFLRTSRLWTLILEGCTRLVEINESIGFLKRLFRLNLRSCKKLRNLPSSISNLESLEILDLWECYKVEELPEQLGNMTALKSLNAGCTAIKQLPSSFNLLKNLEDLSFVGCEYLMKSPELSETSNLFELTFEGCTSLVEIHESIGHLKYLGSLDLKGCKKLRSLPISSTSNLESLGNLILSDCSKLDKLPEQWGNMKALSMLVADGTAIEQLPSSLGDLSNLENLILPGCGGTSSSWISSDNSNRMSLLSISKLRSLIELDLSDRNLSEDEFCIEFECLSSLRRLKLLRNNFRILPSFISCLPNLEALDLSECTSLQSISLPTRVIGLKANGCTSLERISILTNESSGSLDLDMFTVCESMFILNNCRKLVEIQNLERLQCVPRSVHLGSCNNLSSESMNSVLQMMCKTDYVSSVLLPGSEIPNWISHQAMGSSVSFRVPPFLDGCKISKVLLCIVYAANKEAPALGDEIYFIWRLCNKSSRDQSNDWYDVGRCELIERAPDFDIFEDHIHAQVMAWRDTLWYRRNRIKMRSGDEIEVAIDLHTRFQGRGCMRRIDPQIVEVKRCGIHFGLDGDEPSVRDDDEISESESEEDSRL
ncbi:disease resistance protein RPV1-like isoform X2 [Corylus avellana]|uniref:disease resistance protein RPV1-like isoform X2 n=1 Tax=Corylus avellana TaxID=13451 RepID=UPI00286AD677|nr:disease resistance protein RPV1-like isoform X2 [Corylus avellana]